MTPIGKARIVNWLLIGSFAFLILTIFAIRDDVRWIVPKTEGQGFLLILLALLPYGLCSFVAHRWPRCPHCNEPTHTPASGDAPGFLAFLSRPRIPHRECGYCGRDLTASRVPQ